MIEACFEEDYISSTVPETAIPHAVVFCLSKYRLNNAVAEINMPLTDTQKRVPIIRLSLGTIELRQSKIY